MMRKRGTVEEEKMRGDISTRAALAHIHEIKNPKMYLEIGVNKGKSLMLAKCPAIGVDPAPRVKKPKSYHEIYSMKSAQFFKTIAPDRFFKKPKPDMVYIDGMHLIEYVLKDFIYAEKYINRTGVVVFDDVFPSHPAQAERERRTQNWVGDCWKIIYILQKLRPDLRLTYLGTLSGALMVTGCNTFHPALSINYDFLAEDWSVDSPVPQEILNRDFVKYETKQAIEYELA